MNRSLRLAVSALALALAATTFGAVADARTESPAAGVQSGQTATTTPAAVPRIAQQWADAWNGTDPDRLARLFTTDAQYTDYAIGVVSHGRTGVADWKRNTSRLIADAHVRLTHAFRSGDDVAIEGIYSGHIMGAPRPFAVPIATVLKLCGSLIATDADYYSLAAVLAQSGLPADWTPPSQ